ncbi:MAG: sigma-70 family RNA polymerase sigma factor [Dehalococcoidia bacterium]
MITVLENVKDREQVSSGVGTLHSVDDEVVQQEEFPELENRAQKQGLELGEDLLNLYFTEVGQTPLLDEEEAKAFSKQIEVGKYLIRIEEDWVAEHGAEPSAMELLLASLHRFRRARPLFEALYQYLELPPQGSMAEKVSQPALRRAVDGNIDQQLSTAIAEITGDSQTDVEKTIIELALDSRLIPWHILESTGQGSSVDEFVEAPQSPEFHDKLEAHRPAILKHFEQIKEGAHQATNHMIQANLRLVISVAKRHNGWGVPLPDLIQEGNIGLMQAVQKFDHRRGYRFSTYAIPWIWQAINRAVHDQSRKVRLPGHLIDDLTKLGRTRDSLAQNLGRQPTEKELASEMGLPSKKIEALLRVSSGGATSLETPVGDEGAQLGDFIADQTAVQPEEEATVSLLRKDLSRTLESLAPRERRVIELRFGLDDEHSRTLTEVGTELGLTKERIRQIEKEALAKLRHPSHSRDLIEYLE